jgi:hypothetical protein
MPFHHELVVQKQINAVLRWLLPWASVFVVSSTLAYSLNYAVVDGSTMPSAAPTSADHQSLTTVSSDAYGNELRESCVTAWSRVSVSMLRVYPQDFERFAADLCVGSVYVPAPILPDAAYNRT